LPLFAFAILVMKIFFRRIHLYLSLAAGLVILVACLTGAILVFEKDLQMSFNKERYYVAAGSQKLSIEAMTANIKKQYPGTKINSVKIYSDPERSAEFNAVMAPKKVGKEGKAAIEVAAPQNKEKPKAEQPRQPGFTFFVNPYTGVVLEKYSYRETSFYKVFALHRWLLGGEKSIGKYIVGISTLIFLFILVTGVILWWPKTVRIMKQRLQIKWGSGWKRINHDMHLVFGFYSAIFLFIISFTGLAWSFEWFNNGIYKVTGSPLKNPPPPKSASVAGLKRISADTAYLVAAAQLPGAEFINVSFPKDSTEVFAASGLPQNAVHESATNTVYIDQFSGAVAGKMDYAQRSLGARVRSTFKPVHTGSIWGLPSKIIAFIVCLFGVTFPITGSIMWYNRTRKKKKTGKREPVSEEYEEAL
jgi:uncharacterized iron-regulated membrane protein